MDAAVLAARGRRRTAARRRSWRPDDSSARRSGARGGAQALEDGERGPAGSGASKARRSPVAGCVNASRAACRAGRSRDGERLAGRGAARRTASACRRRSASPATGWPIEARCTRIWWVRPVWMRTRRSAAPSKRSSTASEVRASRPRGARTDIFWRWTGSRPIGASISPAGRAGTPSTRARYSFSTVRPANCRTRARWVSSSLATTSRPEVPLVEAVDDARAGGRRRRRRGRCTWREERVDERAAAACPRPGGRRGPAGLSTTRRWASSWTTASGMSSGCGSAGTGAGTVDDGATCPARSRAEARGRRAVERGRGPRRSGPGGARGRARAGAARARRRGAGPRPPRPRRVVARRRRRAPVARIADSSSPDTSELLGMTGGGRLGRRRRVPALAAMRRGQEDRDARAAGRRR